MSERRRNLRNWVIAAAVWVVLVSAAMAWPLLYPHVEPMGASFREDTFGLEMFEMKGEGYPAIERAVTDGALAMAELSEGFRLFMPATMSRLQQSRRVKTAEKIVALHVAEERQTARGPLLALWAGLALGLPLLVLGGAAASRSIRPASGGSSEVPRPTA
jgi:hypothetical protein